MLANTAHWTAVTQECGVSSSSGWHLRHFEKGSREIGRFSVLVQHVCTIYRKYRQNNLHTNKKRKDPQGYHIFSSQIYFCAKLLVFGDKIRNGVCKICLPTVGSLFISCLLQRVCFGVFWQWPQARCNSCFPPENQTEILKLKTVVCKSRENIEMVEQSKNTFFGGKMTKELFCYWGWRTCFDLI